MFCRLMACKNKTKIMCKGKDMSKNEGKFHENKYLVNVKNL